MKKSPSLSLKAAVCAMTLCSCAAELPAQSAINAEHMTVINPEIPYSMKFADEKVDLDDVDLFERLDRELTAMVYTHGTTLLTIKRANRYFPVIMPILEKNGVHKDYAYLACIESNLNTLARSGAGAAGIWQFMPATAKQYGLEVNDEVDERYDLEKSTQAACKYLKSAYGKYKHWDSVAASYNAGTGRISQELSSQQVPSALDLWLVEETRRYPLRMLAMKMIMENPQQYGFTLAANQLYQPHDYTTVTVSGAVADWPAWAIAHGIDYATLREYNPWIRDKKLTNKAGKTYTIRIPKEESLKRSTQKQTIYDSNWVR